jgi:DNA ligase (NAD+)
MISFNSIEEKIEFLIKSNKEYRDGNPIISDEEFDYLEQDLRSLDSENPYFRKIEDESFGLENKLTIHMGSQDKAKDLKEMDKFYNRIDTNEKISVSEKMDGSSIELTYKNGFLIKAISRGDGEMGVDYTSILRGSKDIPKEISNKTFLVIRGEAILLKSDLILLNEELSRDKRDVYVNTRNGVSGLIKSLKNMEYSKYISFRAFNIEGVE